MYVQMIAKGHNLRQRAKHLIRLWELHEHPVAIGFDLSRWDMRVSREMLLLLSQFYTSVFPGEPLLADLLTTLVNNRCKTSAGIRYHRKSGVTSGDMTTALGNCVAVVASNLLYRAILEGRVPIGEGQLCEHKLELGVGQHSESQQEWLQTCPSCCLRDGQHRATKLSPRPGWMSLYDDGDDHVVIVEVKYCRIVEETMGAFWELLGHKLTTTGPRYKLEQVEFCQMRVCTSIPAMVPDPRKVVATSLLLTGKNIRNWKPYLKTVWKARAILHAGTPVLGPLFYRLQAKLPETYLEDTELTHALMRQQYWMTLAEGKLRERLEYQEPTEEASGGR